MKTGFRIAVAQLDCVVGDLAGNVARIVRAAQVARSEGADLLITPELALCGYPPEDLLLWADFREACGRELLRLAELCRGVDVLVGTPHHEDGERYNAAVLLRDGGVQAVYRKVRLPNYEVFDELRYFVSGDQPCVIEIGGVRVGVNVCADIWEPEVVEAASRAGAEVLLVLNASPYHIGKQARRLEVIRQRVRATGMAMLYCNLTGGQDDLVFDGASFAINPDGALAYQAPAFEERVDCLDYRDGEFRGGVNAPKSVLEAEVYAALTLGLRDFVEKGRWAGVTLPLSASLDSLLGLCVAVDALGAERVRVTGISPIDTPAGQQEALCEFACRLGVKVAAEPEIGPGPGDWCCLATGSKRVMALGEPGSAGREGGFGVLKDVPAGLVRRLCVWRNRQAGVFPESLVQWAAGSVGATEGLPSETTVDAILQAFMEYRESPREIVAQGHRAEDVRRVLDRLRRCERWRWQIPPGVRITRCSFGREWRYPLAGGFVDED